MVDVSESRAALRQALAGLLPQLRAYARFLAADRARADDLVQEALVRALAALPQFAPGTSLKAWSFTILRRVFLEQARRRHRESAALETQAHLLADAAESHPAEAADISRLIWSLPPSLREALLLVGAQGMTHEEAASICGVAVGTMRARVSRARALMMRGMADAPEPDA